MTAVSLWTVEKKGKKKLQTSLPPSFPPASSATSTSKAASPRSSARSSFSVCPSFRPSSVPRDGDGEDGERGALLFLSVGRSVAAAVTDLGLRWLSASLAGLSLPLSASRGVIIIVHVVVDDHRRFRRSPFDTSEENLRESEQERTRRRTFTCIGVGSRGYSHTLVWNR